MSLRRDDLRNFLRQCDPKQSLGFEDRRYVSLDELRGDGTRSCIEILERNIVNLDESCQLFTGFTGTGKTTELRQLEGRLAALRDLPTRVVYIDFNEYWDRYSRPAITDVLRIIAYCLDREATLAEGEDPDKRPGYVRKFFDFLAQADVKLKETGFSFYGTKLMLELKNDNDFRRRAEAALEGRFQQFAAQAHDSMAESAARLKKAKGAFMQRLVVIADSIEQLQPLREEDRHAMEESVEMVFVNHAHLLRLPRHLLLLPCHIVYTFPISLRYRRADIGASVDGEPLVLPMVKIAEPDGVPVSHGLQKLTDLVERRLDLARVFGADREATLVPLLRASGGYPRDLLRMIRSLLMESRDFPVRPEDTERVIARLGEDYSRALYATDLDILATVAETHALPRASDEERAAFSRLLDRWFVLAYRNGTEWYNLHPMVRRDPMVDARLRKKKKSGKG